MDPRNTHEKKFGPMKDQREKIRTKEITTRKNVGPKKYPREKIWDPRNTHEKKCQTNEGINGTRHTRSKMTQGPRNLAHSVYDSHLAGSLITSK